MIKNIEIENFKSIIQDKIPLSQFTVIIGANGSGKSNLVKSIDFISNICKYGLVSAIKSFGSYDGIIPKKIAKRKTKGTHVKIGYSVELPPVDDSEINPNYPVRHELEFGYSHKQIVRVISEKLTFSNLFTLTENLYEGLPKLDNLRSSFELFKGAGERIGYRVEPSFNSENLSHYKDWLGSPLSESQINHPNGLRKVLNAIEKNFRKDNKQSQSLIEPNVKTILDFSTEFDALRRVIRYIRRYDLLLSELRCEQSTGDPFMLSSNGDNMPVVLRNMKSDSEYQESLDRIMRSIEEICPHINDVESKSLASGKDFVQFIETKVGRAVESWESSDGTLRVLAMLLALELQPEYSTLLMEEPESNLHPWAIKPLIEHVRQVIKDRNIQVIMTTHSQQVLEMAYPEEVLVTTRYGDEGTKFRPLADVVPNANIEIGEIGRMWVKGLLGAVPNIE